MMLVRNFDAWEVAIGIKASAPFRYDNLQQKGDSALKRIPKLAPAKAGGEALAKSPRAPRRFLVRPHKIHTITMNEFFQNVSRYASYFVTVMLGIFFFTFGWLKPLLKKPATAIALVGFLVAGFFFISFTLKAMLGLA